MALYYIQTVRIKQSNLAIRNFFVTLNLFLNAKCSLFISSKWQIGHEKWFLNTIKFLIAKFDCTKIPFRIEIDILFHNSSEIKQYHNSKSVFRKCWYKIKSYRRFWCLQLPNHSFLPKNTFYFLGDLLCYIIIYRVRHMYLDDFWKWVWHPSESSHTYKIF